MSSPYYNAVGQFLFGGRTYNPATDFVRLKQKVKGTLIRLLDYEWHGRDSLRPWGGDAYRSRVSNLGEARFGGFVIERERDPETEDTMFRYRLDRASVTEAKVEAIFNWTIPSDRKVEAKGLAEERKRIRKSIKVLSLEECESVSAHIEVLLAARAPEQPVEAEDWLADLFDEL